MTRYPMLDRVLDYMYVNCNPPSTLDATRMVSKNLTTHQLEDLSIHLHVIRTLTGMRGGIFQHDQQAEKPVTSQQVSQFLNVSMPK